MKCNDLTFEQESHGTFKAILRGQSLLDKFTRKNGAIFLICGPPGAGKTTLALYFLHDFYHELKKRPNALLLSLVETSEQIEKICELYKFEFGTQKNKASVHLIPARFDAEDEFNVTKIAEAVGLNLKPCDLLLIDGVSALVTQERYRKKLLALLDQIKCQHQLLTILVAEEYRENEDAFLQYAVDGIIRLSVDPILNSRKIEVSKLRWHDHYLGSHAFKLRMSIRNSKSGGVFFFPSVNCLIGERITKQGEFDNNIDISKISEVEGLSSGVEGFDQIAISDIKGGPFQPRDQVLLIGPSGSGKFLFGTQFLATAPQNEISVCISFVRTFPEIKARFLSLPHSDDKQECHCLTFSPTGLVVEEMLGAVHNLLCNFEKTITRVFIDGLSALRCLFSTNETFESFFLSFLRLLKTFPKVVTLVSYHTPRVFASYAEIDIPAGEWFSMVVGFNFQEHHNKLKPGIVILKSRITISDKSLKVPVISDGIYTLDLNAGWPRVGLLGGEREEEEERPFVKLFFENKSEEEIIKQPFEDFAGRYPKDHIFRMVAKSNPQPNHWSFLGYAGPGHSNTKLVELRKYVMDVLRERRVFMEVSEELEQKLQDRFEPGFLWNDSTSHSRVPPVMVPFYADIGVLVYQEDALKEIQGKSEITSPDLPSTWHELIEMIHKFKPDKGKKIRHLFIIPDTVSDTKNFVSFFFELCWTYGWKFPHSDSRGDIQDALSELQEWVMGDHFHHAIELMNWMVSQGKIREEEDLIPNPNVGGHYHESVFSRRWFSKIHLLPRDAENRAKDGKKAFRFGIAPLPGVQKIDNSYPGISNVDLYSLAIIKDALAPETGLMLASGLCEKEVDIQRTYHKRGLPISHKMFRIRLIQDMLGASPPPPPADKDFYENQDKLFKQYVKTLNSILGESEENTPRFRRTADIPKFYYLEELLARKLPRLFDDPPANEAKIKDEILKELEGIYKNQNNTST
ncbi:MAG: ATPase domain-containing protein [Candidatus Aminicenantes bacterium]|jgi:KaiC/GvpD/RAD55 family RecA-like ATPase